MPSFNIIPSEASLQVLSKNKDIRGKYTPHRKRPRKRRQTESGEAKKRQAKGCKEAKSRGLWEVTDCVSWLKAVNY